LPVSTFAQEEVVVDVHIIYESTRTRLNNLVMVAGIWHHVNVTMETLNFQNLILKYYKGKSIPTEENRDASNYYEWRYNLNNQQWTDVNEYEGYTYINAELCKKKDDTYSFCIGIKDTLPATILVEKPSTGIAKTHGDLIQFHVAPFTKMEDPGDDYIRIENRGNTPLKVSITYGTYDDFIEFPGFNTILSPYSASTHTPIVDSESWKPQILTTDSGVISGSISDTYIISSAAFTLEPTVQINGPELKINVGHSNYKIEPLQDTNIIFQYEEKLDMSEDEIKDINVYISGSGVVAFDVRSNENIDILKVFNNQGDETGTHLEITSTDASEYKITIRVKALRENTVGSLYYDLEIGGDTKTYFTTINIGPIEDSSGGSTASLDITVIAGLLVVILVVIIYMVYTSKKHKRRY